MRPALFFRPSGLALARVSTYPDGLEIPGHLDDGDDVAQADRRWLTRIWARADVRAALRLASPSLADQLDDVTSEGTCDQVSAERLRRLTLAVTSYLLRWQRRPVPFGVFAGIAPVSTGKAASLSFGPGHRVVMRADGQWLATVVDRLEQRPELLPRLRVVINNTCFVRGGRVVLADRPSTGQVGPLTEVSIRCTRPAQRALGMASTPIAFDRLADQLAAAFPAAAPSAIGAMLADLVAQGFLLTSLRPPATVVDGLPHVTGHLRAVASGLPDVAALVRDLDDVQAHLARPPAGDPLAHTDLPELVRRMTSICDSTSIVLAADTAVDARICLPGAVLDEAAAAAASLLLRLTTRPFGPEIWRDYHLAFRHRYGPGALVPVRELIADSGLGLPTGFLGSACERPARAASSRDTLLLRLIQQTMAQGYPEITLTESLIDDLTVGDPAQMVIPRRAELPFHVQAESAQAIEAGAFHLWVSGAPRTSSSMAGRFAHLLSANERVALAASFAPDDHDEVVAQLSFPPRRRHEENVVRVPPLLPEVIGLAEHPVPGTATMSVDDLAVTADARQMFLIQLSTGRRVMPWVLHALEASLHTPPLARFLAGVPRARHAVYGLFDWGAARKLPYLPRLRYGRIVLAPARWILTSADVGARGEAVHVWDKHFDAWRERWRVPSQVVLYQQEARLPLDLEARLDRILLRHRLDRAGQVELHESPTVDWSGRACEFLATLTAVPTRTPAPPAVVERPAAMLMPGAGDLVHARLVGHPARYDEILTGHLPRLLEAVGPTRWWYRRYRDTLRPDSLQQVWLYLQLADPSQYGAAAGHLAAFAADLQARGLLSGLSLDCYQPQTGRYGPGTALQAAHRVAAADSAAALAQITMASLAALPAQAITAASMADLAAGLAASEEGYGWLVHVLERTFGPLDLHLRDTTLRLSDPATDYQLLRAHPGGTAVAETWQARRAALNHYRAELSRHDRLPITVLRSLLHDHHVRALGVAPDAEAVTNRLARAAALRLLAAHGQDAP